jgi:alkanesulfonate monooxygenase SsuD/methylene tetrahydromethanopterin reductase-like flavin-dependent oxidoreductase (luciferase family)
VELITAVWLPVVRGPVVLARAYIALDLLSNGRIIAGIGSGSSALDFAGAGIPFEERWLRFDESVHVLRALFDPQAAPFKGRFYSTEGIVLQPGPVQEGGPSLWIGTWGSEAGLRRTARSGDGWLASAYNSTPETFGAAWLRLQELLPAQGKDPVTFPNAIATMALYVTEDPVAADHVLEDILGPTLHRDPEALRRTLLVGSPEACAQTLRAYREAGAQQILLMPVIDGFRQLDLFVERVLPLVGN